jgi:hypothetical protein
MGHANIDVTQQFARSLRRDLGAVESTASKLSSVRCMGVLASSF